MMMLLPASNLLAQEWPGITTQPAPVYKSTHDITEIIKYAEAVQETKPDSALYLLGSALAAARRVQFVKGVQQSLINLGNTLVLVGEFDSAIVSYRQALRYPCSDKDSAIIYHGLGKTLSLSSQHTESISAYLVSIKILEQIKESNIQNLILLYHDIAVTLLHANYHQKSIQYINKALQITGESTSTEYKSKLLNIKGINYYYGLHKTDSALYFLDSALALASGSKRYSSMHPVLVNRGTLYLKENRLTEAIAAFRKAKAITEKYPIHLNDRIANISALGDAYLESGDGTNAEKYLLEAWSYAEKLPREKMFISSRLAQLYERRADFKKAYQYQMAYLDMVQKTYTTESIAKINELETNYRTAEKDRQLAQNQLLISKQKNKLTRKSLWITIMVSTSAGIALLFTWIYFYQRQKNKLLQSQQKFAELKARMEGEEEERRRIAQELHDGINSQLAGAYSYLRTIGNLAPVVLSMKPYQEVGSILRNSAMDIRNIAHNLLPPDVDGTLLPNVMEHLSERFSIAHKLKVEFNAYGNFKKMAPPTALSIYRIYQELLQNVDKHAHASAVFALLNQQGEEFSLTVEDNGVGMQEYGLSKGIGWLNIENRVKLLNGRVSLESGKDRGTTVVVTAPIK